MDFWLGKSMLLNMNRSILLTAAASSLFTLLAVVSFGYAVMPKDVNLENARVKVSTVTYEPGVARERYTRPTDQLIVFLNDCKYQRIDSARRSTGQWDG